CPGTFALASAVRIDLPPTGLSSCCWRRPEHAGAFGSGIWTRRRQERAFAPRGRAQLPTNAPPWHHARPQRLVTRGPPACSSAILRGVALHLTCKGTQQARLLLQVIQSMLQHVANADHADQTISLLHRQMPDVARQHC